MLFDSEDEVFEYYRQYGMQMGFAILKRISRKIGEISTYLTVAYHRYGKPHRKADDSLKPQHVVKSDCKVRISAKRLDGSKWCVTQFDDEHNHGLSPSKSYRYRCNRKLTKRAKRSLNLCDATDISMNKSFNAIVVEHGGHENLSFNKKDCENYMITIRQLKLANGDATALHNYFYHAQATDSNFYYSIDHDDDNRIRNIFWADARCRAAYEEFGDVVTFDTTYLTNKYDMPFAPFVGVNHHGQSILLGCGLISSEDMSTFAWLFRAWLTCMSYNPPTAIITDQDKAMQNAIEIVFPNARHRWCLWHIMKKIPEKLRGYKSYESIKFLLQNIVYDSRTIDVFESGWSNMVEKYELDENQWLNTLYEDRHKWVPCFVNLFFWGGMSTTQRSESMNAFFDGYVIAKTSLREFVEKYDNALRDKVEKETAADTQSLSTSIPCVTHHDMEKQIQSIYTNDKFKEFQREMINMMHCECILKQCEGSIFYYQVEEIQYVGETQTRRNVVFNVCFIKEKEEECDVKCDCRLFEFQGIICRHIVKVLLFKHGIFTILSKYILRRWRKDIKRRHTKTKVSYSTWKVTEERRRYDKIYDAFHEISDMACENEERCNQLLGQFDELKLDWKNNVDSGSNGIYSNAQPGSENKKSSKWTLNVRSPVKKRSKGRSPTKRKQSKTDQIVNTLKKKSKKIEKKNCNNIFTFVDVQEDRHKNNFDLNEIAPSEECSVLRSTNSHGVTMEDFYSPDKY